MKEYLKKDPWSIIEEQFDQENNEISESIFSIGNGYMGQRANFSELYSGPSLQGSYIGGIYYPDKTRVGWWKNGYPEYFAKVLNSVNWIGLRISLGEEPIDLAEVEFNDFRRVLDMKSGILRMSYAFTTKSGSAFNVHTERLCHKSRKSLGLLQYKIQSVDYNGPITIESYLDFDVKNQDSNYDEQFWSPVAEGHSDSQYVEAKTKKTDFQVRATMSNAVSFSGSSLESSSVSKSMYSSESYSATINSGQDILIEKYVSIDTSLNHKLSELSAAATNTLNQIKDITYESLVKEHEQAWAEVWEQCDITIDGDVSAQQAVRFNIFHLYQTYDGTDDRLNIGPKGFTGEKYGGVTYWDTEAYCLPFYMGTTGSDVAYSLLKYRYLHLAKAIENAEKLGFKNGAALYPMVTMNGEECHNEWEITFEEIHRNGAIAYAIYDYTRYTNDASYLIDYGIDVLVGIARFWAQRVNWSDDKKGFVMLGVTGPNEYENNVNNNWYTNYIAVWCLKYCIESIDYIKKHKAARYQKLVDALSWDDKEATQWQNIIDYMYYPYDEQRKIFLQQDGFLDKELIDVSQLNPEDQPLNQNWSWDRILRSCYIKQADVLQGMYFFEDQFDTETIKRHFDFYEPLTVHESSLSPCVHAILASRLQYEEKAYEMYLRTARLDLDNYNNDTEDGLHITSMAGTWMSIVRGFGGMKMYGGRISFTPFIPKQWEGYTFKIKYRSHNITVTVDHNTASFHNNSEDQLELIVNDNAVEIGSMENFKIQLTA
jgi:maltose phosphorylase